MIETIHTSGSVYFFLERLERVHYWCYHLRKSINVGTARVIKDPNAKGPTDQVAVV